MRVLAIVGTAGRNEDVSKLTRQHYDSMYKTVKQLMLSSADSNNGNCSDDSCINDCTSNCTDKDSSIGSLADDAVISGGSAQVDHAAVRLYLEGVVKQLILCLPYPFNHGSYSDAHLNGLHHNFSSKCNIDSLAQLQAAIEAGTEVVYGSGYHARNTLIAQLQ